jgi:hypothetical protein
MKKTCGFFLVFSLLTVLTRQANAEPAAGGLFTPQGQAILDAFTNHYEDANASFDQQTLTLQGSAAADWKSGSLNLLPLLPAGQTTLNHVKWKIAPVKVDGASRAQLAVNQKTDVLFFMHTCEPGAAVRAWWHQSAIEKRRGERAPQAPVIFSYRVRYADQTELIVPVLFGKSIERWYRVGLAGEMAHAQPVTLKRDADTWENAVVYCMKWINPRPDVAVVSVEATTDGATPDAGTALILGVTAGTRTGKGSGYVISPDGNDNNPGTLEKPWATFAKFSTLQPGDTLYVRGGLYRVAQPVVLTAKGTAQNWITLTAWPGERPVFNAEDFIKNPKLREDKASVFDFQACEFLRVEGLEVERSPAAGVSCGGGSKYVDFVGNTIYLTRATGLWMNSDLEFDRAIGNTVIRPNSRDMRYDAEGNKVYHSNSAHEGVDFNGTWGECAFNEVYFGDKELIDCKGKNHNVVIHHNYLHRGVSSGIYVDAWNKAGLTNMEICYNTLDQSGGGINLGSEVKQSLTNVRVHHNLIVGSHHGGIGVFGTATSGIRIWNNTLVSCAWSFKARGWSGGGISLTGGPDGAPTDIEIRDNLIVDSAQFSISINENYPTNALAQLVINHNQLSPQLTEPRYSTRDQRILINGENPLFEEPRFRNAAAGDYCLAPDSPVANPQPGAFPLSVASHPGFALGGQVLASMVSDKELAAETDASTLRVIGKAGVRQPVPIPGKQLNTYLTHHSSPVWINSGQFMGGPYMLDIRDLPRGIQTLAGITWYIRNPLDAAGPEACVLSSSVSAIRDVSSVIGIPVGRKTDRLHFLHTFAVGPAIKAPAEDVGAVREKNPEVFHYVVHYADGESVKIPIHYLQEIGPYLSTTQRPQLGAAVQVAWEISTVALTRKTHAAKGGKVVNVPAFINTVYAYSWKNPRPAVEITGIDLVSGNTATRDFGAAALLAISAD